MGYLEKPNVYTTVNMPNGIPTFPKISSFVKQIIKSAQFYFHESEAFEVKEVFLYTHEDKKKFSEEIEKFANELENEVYYLKEFYPNDRNAFLFLDIYSQEIAQFLGEMEMYDALILLSNYDVDNKAIYNKHIN